MVYGILLCRAGKHAEMVLPLFVRSHKAVFYWDARETRASGEHIRAFGWSTVCKCSGSRPEEERLFRCSAFHTRPRNRVPPPPRLPSQTLAFELSSKAVVVMARTPLCTRTRERERRAARTTTAFVFLPQLGLGERETTGHTQVLCWGRSAAAPSLRCCPSLPSPARRLFFSWSTPGAQHVVESRCKSLSH